jgi:hypothetical protein
MGSNANSKPGHYNFQKKKKTTQTSDVMMTMNQPTSTSNVLRDSTNKKHRPASRSSYDTRNKYVLAKKRTFNLEGKIRKNNLFI